jgi:O-antigen/teichoic acid export membrane protein
VEGLRKRLTVGAIWTAGGRLVINLVGLASTLVLARLLTPADFGLVAIATVVFTIASAFTELSMASALIQHRDPQREHYDTAWTISVLRALTVAAALGISAYPVAVAYGDMRLIGIMCLLGIAAFIGGLLNPKLVDFRRQLSFQQEMLTEFVKKAVGFVVGVCIAYWFRSYWALVIGSFAAQVAGLVLSYVLIPFVPRFSLKHWHSLFSFSGWLALSSGLNAINYRGDQLAIGAVLGTEQLGQYSVGDNLASLPVRESTAPLAYLLFPAFSRLQDDPERLREAFLRSQRLFVATALPVGIGLSLVAEPLVQLVLGAQWALAATVIQVLSTVVAVHAFSTPLSSTAMALGQTRLLFVRDMLNLGVRYPLILAGLFSSGLMGLLLGRCLAGVFAVGVDIYLARRLVGASAFNQIVSNWRAMAAAGIMAISVWGLGALGINRATYLDLALLVITGAISYLGATVALWLAAGRPAGPEREALDMLQLARRRVGGTWAKG